MVIDDSKPICLGSTSELPIRSNHYTVVINVCLGTTSFNHLSVDCIGRVS